MLKAKWVLAMAIAVGIGVSSLSKANAQWGGCPTPQAYRAYSVGYGPGWNSYSSMYRAGFYGVPGYYRSAGFYSGPGVYAVRRPVAAVPVPVFRPVVVAPAWGPGWGGSFGPGWGPGFGPGWGGSGVGLRVGF